MTSSVRFFFALVVSVFILSNYGTHRAVAAESIEFDDGCDAGDEKCEFWKCYETGKCSEKDASRFKPKVTRKVSESIKPKETSVLKHDRSLSSSVSGLRIVNEACEMRVEPKKNSEANGLRIRKGSKIWTDPSVNGWFKIYHRKGHAYVQRDCF